MSIPITKPDLPAALLHVAYEHTPAPELLAQTDVLAVLGFGKAALLPDDPRVLRVGLEPLCATALEVWRGAAPVRSGRDADLRWSSDGRHAFFAIEVDEAAHGDLVQASEYAYRTLTRAVRDSDTPCLLRLWNYLDAINEGAGDAERYRLFCEGRARGMQGADFSLYPAATAIGRQDGQRVLQVYGLAARSGGIAVENPRQISAWRYPRQYGPTAPIFTRGMLMSSAQLLISGTAAVVGHASTHEDDLAAQIGETLVNLDSLLDHASPTPTRFNGHTVLKAYVRAPSDAAQVRQAVNEHAPALGEMMLLSGDICRSELLVEIDGIHSIGV